MSGTSYHRTSWRHRQSIRSRTGWIDTGTIWAFKADSYIAHHPQVTSKVDYLTRSLLPALLHSGSFRFAWRYFIVGTACAVVQAVVKYNSQSNGKGQISSRPPGSKTPERIFLKPRIYDYVAGQIHVALWRRRWSRRRTRDMSHVLIS